jgi:hypothetical protein
MLPDRSIFWAGDLLAAAPTGPQQPEPGKLAGAVSDLKPFDKKARITGNPLRINIQQRD